MKTKRVLSLCLAMLLALGTLPATLAETLPELTVLGTYNAHDPNNDPTATAISEKTGYKVTYSMLPSENGDQNLYMQVASGAAYDIIRSGPNEFRTLVEKGALLPLNDLLDQYGDVLKQVISQETWDLATYDGKIYGIPMMNERPNIENTILMRKDILDALSLAVPTTPDEFYQVLAAVKNAYPDMIPFTMSGGVYSETLISGFGFYFDWNERDGKLVNYVELPEYQEYLSYMLKLYNEGLLDQDLAINTGVTVDEKFASGKVFAVASGWFNAANQVPALYQNVPDAVITYVDPLTDKNGKAAIRANKYLNNVSFIPKTAQHPEDAVKFMNKKLSEDVFTNITLGEEGVHFTKEGNSYNPIMPIFTEARGNAWWYLNGIREVEYADMWMARTRRNPELGKAFDAANANFDKYAVFSPVGTMPTLPSVSKYTSSLSEMIKDYTIQLMVGVEKLENFGTFQEQWRANGGAECTTDVNAWYSAK